MHCIRPNGLLTVYSSHWNYSDSDSESDSDSGGGIDLWIRVSTHRNTVDLRVIYIDLADEPHLQTLYPGAVSKITQLQQ